MMRAHTRFMLIIIMVLTLTIIPLPQSIMHARPPFELLLVLYVQFYLPEYFRVALICFLGLCIDVLTSSVMGQHACVMLLITWLATNQARRFSFFSILQQMLLICLYCFLYQCILAVINAFLGYPSSVNLVITPTIFGVLSWPWLKWISQRWLLPVCSNKSMSLIL